MPSPRTYASALVLAVAAFAAGAHYYMTQLAMPTYSSLCERAPAAIRATGFGTGQRPDVMVCVGGRQVPATVALDETSGMLTIESSASLAPFDGVRRGPESVRVDATTVDHSRDSLPARVLEAVTPFASFDRTRPVASDADDPYERVEVAMPRVTTTGSTSQLELELGTHVSNDTLSVLVRAKR